MSDNLFDLPPAMPSELDAARLRLSLATADFSDAQDNERDSGEPMPLAVLSELRDAKAEVLRLESREIERRRAGE